MAISLVFIQKKKKMYIRYSQESAKKMIPKKIMLHQSSMEGK